MAAFEPWRQSMDSLNADSSAPTTSSEPPTVAAFSPTTYARTPSHARQRSTILVQQKSPLLVATPPQVTRALAYSHPFILPLDKLLALISWTTGDPWQSFLMLCIFWAGTLYGDTLIRFAGPIVFALILITGIWARRYSPISSTGWTSEAAAAAPGDLKPTSKEADGANKHHKSLDEILETLKLFTNRCNILLDPWIQLTDFLSTQRTATSATTRPALTSLFIRILLVTPIWILFTFHPIALVTTRRVILVAGTIFLSWHSRPAVVSRTILWRSHMLRQTTALVTGLTFAHPQTAAARNATAIALAQKGLDSKTAREGLRLTWSLWENQRRWIGIGWTASMLAYERTAWSDDALNPAPSKEEFTLPTVEGGIAKWRWVKDSKWTVAPQSFAADKKKDKDKEREKEKEEEQEGWIFYDNSWRDPRGSDGWGRYTRRRKWVREAELVEVQPGEESDEATTPVATPRPSFTRSRSKNKRESKEAAAAAEKGRKSLELREDDGDGISVKSSGSKKDRSASGWFRRRKSHKEGKHSRSSSVSRDSISRAGAGGSASSILGQDGSGDAHIAGEEEVVRGTSPGGHLRPGGTVARDVPGREGRGGHAQGQDDYGLASSPEDDVLVPLSHRGRDAGIGAGWGVGEDAGMELG